MKPLLKAAGALFLGFAFLALFMVLVLVFIPATEEELIRKAKEDYPQQLMPILIAHKPEINSVTYENTVSYCAVTPTEFTDTEIGGVTDDYTCEIMGKGYVSNTEELRMHLLRKMIAIQIDEIRAQYGMDIAKVPTYTIIAAVAFVIAIFAAFPFLYFGSDALPDMAFAAALLCAMFSFGYFVLSILLFFLLPGAIEGVALGYAYEPLHEDLISVAMPAVDEAVQGLFLPPMLLFGLCMLASSFATAAFFMYTGSKPRHRKPETAPPKYRRKPRA